MPLGIGPLELIIALVVTLAVIGLIKAVLRGAVKDVLRSHTAAATTASPADELAKLQTLRQSGVLTDTEFESQKRAVLNR